MAVSLGKILIVGEDGAERTRLRGWLEAAGYDLQKAESAEEAVRTLGREAVDLIVLLEVGAEASIRGILSFLLSAGEGDRPRVLLVVKEESDHNVRWLDLGADDVVSPSTSEAELLARVRAQLRQKRLLAQLAEKMRNAEETYQASQTAFQALAVTEKMTRDAFSLERLLKRGVGALFILALVIAGIFFLYSRRAEKETRRTNTVISQLEHSVQNEEQLLASARRLRADPSNEDWFEQREQLQKQTEVLRQKLASPGGGDVGELRHQLEETTNRLNKIEGNSQAAEGVIRNYAPSVCLLHVSVAFNEKESGRRLRYGGMDSQGQPLKDSDGHLVYTTTGRGPEVRADFFGTGFVAGEGRILTNHHVVQPWWENEELSGAMKQGLEPVIAELTAYFPDAAHGIPVGISQISEEADLALVHGDLSELKLPALRMDLRKDAAVSGEALISLGYATGLDAILARAGEDTVEQIVKVSEGDPKLVLAELAKRRLIRPLVTQGHVGDVLPDRIVYDAQTTSGSSGGPLLDHQGQVIGVTFAVVRGFGGSNFGVPIRFAVPLLKH